MPNLYERCGRFTRLKLLGALLAVIFGLPACSSDDGASLQPERPKRTLYLTLIPKQKAFTVSTLFIDGAAGKDLEILKVQPLGSPNVAYIGAISVWPRDRDSVSDGGEGFPTRGIKTSHPAIGTVVPAAETGFVHPGEPGAPRPVVVNAGFRLLSGSVGFVNGVQVTYRVGDERRSERARTAMIVCMEPCKERDAFGDIREWELALRDQLGVQELTLQGDAG